MIPLVIEKIQEPISAGSMWSRKQCRSKNFSSLPAACRFLMLTNMSLMPWLWAHWCSSWHCTDKTSITATPIQLMTAALSFSHLLLILNLSISKQFALAAKTLEIIAVLGARDSLKVLIVQLPGVCCTTDSLFFKWISIPLQTLYFCLWRFHCDA